MSMFKLIHYFSTVRGVTEQLTQQATVYYGVMFRVKRADFTTERQFELEDKVLNQLAEWIKTSPIESSQFVKDGIVERYDVYEAGTGDVLVMYRVPFQDHPVRPKGGYVN